MVSLHLPLSPESRSLLNGASFAQMRQGAVFVTTARGNIHDEPALHEALRNGHLAGAGLDVWEQEPPNPGHPLLHMTNVIVTQHTAGVTHESRANITRIAALAFADAAKGKLPPRIINPARCAALRGTLREEAGAGDRLIPRRGRGSAVTLSHAHTRAALSRACHAAISSARRKVCAMSSSPLSSAWRCARRPRRGRSPGRHHHLLLQVDGDAGIAGAFLHRRASCSTSSIGSATGSRPFWKQLL